MSKWNRKQEPISGLPPVEPPKPAAASPRPDVGTWFRIRRGHSFSSGAQGWFLERLDVTADGAKVTVLHGPDLFGICEARLGQFFT